MTTDFVHAPIPLFYTLNSIWGHNPLAQHLDSVATLEDFVKLDAPQTLYSPPEWCSPWFQLGTEHRRQYTATLFDPTDEIVIPTKKGNHFSGPKEPRISLTSVSRTENSTKEESLSKSQLLGVKMLLLTLWQNRLLRLFLIGRLSHLALIRQQITQEIF